jgi:hypothetical protein
MFLDLAISEMSMNFYQTTQHNIPKTVTFILQKVFVKMVLQKFNHNEHCSKHI